ncbi:MutS2 protein [Propionispora sp. 2/2-37]|uniref:endonuclease MutS2 n=1 Tax=Propionispora sp. 2/2-37 TaxID=1677858 RepID=UPI0006BB7170|nr:endonuclease MutS2 [Propionispora sp. 2/2-37]CUH96202.1 MutS2 protein [Propionispora sp. 2/2-37]
MNDLALHILEYHKIIEQLACNTTSTMGRELAEALLPTGDMVQVEARLAETSEAREVMSLVPSVPLGGIRDIRHVIRRAELGAILEPADLLAVGSVLYASRRIKHFFYELTKPVPILAGLVEQIAVQRQLENTIENTVTEQGNIRDDASVELLRLRRAIRNTQASIKDKMDHILRSGEYQKFVQDSLITIRSDRYVIPIKQEYRQHFPGIVHDQSASGATVFIEPMAVVNLNNDIKQFTAAEKNEIERILATVSAQIGKESEAIIHNCQMLSQIDFAFAKARLSFAMEAQMPQINKQGYVHLQRARHPLIPSDVVVPIDIRLGRDFNTLLITGPNTGGKTVALKTIGLFALMAQAGLFIPAASGSAISVFSNIFADIGDEQSIEQSLSTFSSHMTNIVKILQQASSRDLVLIDEIGAGTDPEEGAALAMAILEYLLQTGVKTVATTHYSELKTFAYSHNGIENASVEFDVETLRPTYRLLIGIPGSSNAFAISRRLGLSGTIISRAQELIEREHAELENVLNSLEEQKVTYSRRNEEIIKLERELKLKHAQVTQEYSDLMEKKSKMLRKAQQEAATLLRQTKREAEEVIAELKAQFAVKDERERQLAVTNARKRLQESGANLQDISEEPDHLPHLSPQQIRPGLRVFVTTLKQTGTILSAGSEELTVQLGIMKVNVPLAVCRLAEQKGEGERQCRKSSDGRKLDVSQRREVARQIDIRGNTVEEAEMILGKYLDDAVVAGLTQVLVIHGKGTGALRKGIRAYLKQHYHVKDISIGEVTEGGDGATVVRLS